MVLLLSTALAGDAWLDTYEEWGERALAEIAPPGAPPPYRATMAGLDAWDVQVSAKFGQPFKRSESRIRPGRVELVIGDPRLDSARFADDRGTLGMVNWVVDDDPLAWSRDLWLATDSAYLGALSQFGIKWSARQAQGPGHAPDDWTEAPPVVAEDAVEIVKPDGDALEALVSSASALWLQHPEVRYGGVNGRCLEGAYRLWTSEGTRLIDGEGFCVVYAWADRVTEGGVWIYDRWQWVGRTLADLDEAAILGGVEDMLATLDARAGATEVDYYEGPVVFADNGAADFFRYLGARELLGTPPPPSGEQTYQRLMRNEPRIGRRLLPAGWSVTDDPTSARPDEAGGYVHDREGSPARAVQLVDDGLVVDLAMSRVPRHDREDSTGHARGPIKGDWTARLSLWEVTAPKNLRERAFWRRVDRKMRSENLERILVVERMSNGKHGSLPRPTKGHWRYADGRTEPIQSLYFQKDDRRALRDVVLAGGGQVERAYLEPFDAKATVDDVTGLASVITTPRLVLVETMEAAHPGPDRKPAVVPMPDL